MTWAGLFMLFDKFHIRKSSLMSMAKNSHSRVMYLRPPAELVRIDWFCYFLSSATALCLITSSLKYSRHQLMETIGYLQAWYQTVTGEVYCLWNIL